MKEIKMNGKLECRISSPLQRHMKNVENKLNELAVAVKEAKKDGYAISVDISNLDKEEEIERWLLMLTVEIEGKINEMLGGTFYEVYERTSKAKKELEIALTELEELGMKVDVVYLSDKER